MSNRAKRAGSGLARWFKGRFDPQKATEEMAVTYVTQLGMMSDRLEALREMSLDENFESEIDTFISWTGHVFEIAIPWMRAKDDPFLLKKIDAYLNNHKLFLLAKSRLTYRTEIIQRDERVLIALVTKQVQEEKLDPKLRSILLGYLEQEGRDTQGETREGQTDDSVGAQEAIAKYGSLIDRTVPTRLRITLNHQTVTLIKRTVSQWRVDMFQDAKFIISLSFGKEDVGPSKTIVWSKPEVTRRMRTGPATGSSFDVSAIVKNMEAIRGRIEEYQASQEA